MLFKTITTKTISKETKKKKQILLFIKRAWFFIQIGWGKLEVYFSLYLVDRLSPWKKTQSYCLKLVSEKYLTLELGWGFIWFTSDEWRIHQTISTSFVLDIIFWYQKIILAGLFALIKIFQRISFISLRKITTLYRIFVIVKGTTEKHM